MEKQTIYIINTVILTRLSYRILNTFLNLTTMRKITNKYTNIAKHKAELASLVPNSILHYYRLYSLRTVENLQAQQNISLLHNLINSSNGFNTIFKGRI